LDDRFRLLKLASRSADPRHNALHAAFDWSYSLLSGAEQRVFNLLGTFAGSFSLKTAACCVANESVGRADAVDLLGRLVDRSLVSVLDGDPPRYTLLRAPGTTRSRGLRPRASCSRPRRAWRVR